ncbi:MAG: hypothetical protein QW394_07180 [Thermofilaceae archaeon]
MSRRSVLPQVKVPESVVAALDRLVERGFSAQGTKLSLKGFAAS